MIFMKMNNQKEDINNNLNDMINKISATEDCLSYILNIVKIFLMLGGIYKVLIQKQ